MIHKKSVMGVGVLIIFISSVLVAAIAAGVLIRTTGALQQSSLLVGNAVRENLLQGLQVVSITGNVNGSTDKIHEVEMLARLNPGSNSAQLNNLGWVYSSGSVAISAELNSSISCSDWTVLPYQTNYCFEPRFGDNDTIVELGELITLRYKLNATNAITTDQELDISLIPKKGDIQTILVSTPEVFDKVRIRLYP